MSQQTSADMAACVRERMGAQHSTAQRSTAQRCAVQRGTVLHSPR